MQARLLDKTSSGRRAVITNFAWLLADRCVRLGIGFFVSLLVARYLGPHDFGRLSYAMSLVALVGVAVPLGLDAAAKREMVAPARSVDTVVSSVVGLRGTVMVASVLFVVGLVLATDSPDGTLILFASGTLLVPVASSLDLFLEAKLFGRAAFWARGFASVGGATLRVALMALHAPVQAFAAAAAVESTLLLIALILAVRRKTGGISFRAFDLRFATGLLRESWPLVIAGVAVTIYARIDQVMLNRYLGESAVGVYSAATKLSELAYFLPMILASTLFPSLVRARGESADTFRYESQRIFDLNSLAGIAISVFWWVASDTWVRILYGPSFSDAGPVLAVHAWGNVFVFLGVARGYVLSIGGNTLVQLSSTVIGAAMNVTLNLIWIPKHGMVGAAWATLVAQGCAAWLSLAFFRDGRAVFLQLSLALAIPVFGWRRLFAKARDQTR